MERDRYEKIVEACSLNKDLEVLPFGDQAIIGERGINLSGQKQRIQFERALYGDADIFLFDDRFCDVDAYTGSHLFRECILGLLDKIVIYVTHQVEFLPAADLILVMKDGRITQVGKYDDILNSGSNFMELVGAHKRALSAIDSTGFTKLIEEDSSMGRADKVTQLTLKDDNQNGEEGDIVGPKGQLVQEEKREQG